MFDTAGQEAAAENQQDVRENRTEHAGLYDSDFAIAERNNTNLHDVSHVTA